MQLFGPAQISQPYSIVWYSIARPDSRWLSKRMGLLRGSMDGGGGGDGDADVVYIKGDVFPFVDR